MKTYNEMARDVLERAEMEIKTKKQARIAISSLLTGCMAVLLTCFFIGGEATPLLPSVGGEPSTSAKPVVQQGFLQAVCYSNGAITTAPLERHIPMQFVLEATDVQGMTDTEIEQLRQEKLRDLAQMEQAWAQEGYAYRTSTYQGDAVIVYASTGGFQLDVEDWSKVKEIRGKCESPYGKIQCAIHAPLLSTKDISYRLIDANGTEHTVDKPVYRWGNCWIYGQEVVIPGESLRAVYEDVQKGEGSLLFSWEPNEALFNAMEADANFDLPKTEFSFTLCYEDGTQTVHTFVAESHDGVGYIACVD